MPTVHDNLEALVASRRLISLIDAIAHDRAGLCIPEVQAVMNVYAAGLMPTVPILLAVIAALLAQVRGKEAVPPIVD